MSKIQYRPGKDLMAQIEEYSRDGTTPDKISRAFTQRYMDIVRKHVPYFDEDEWGILRACYEAEPTEDPDALVRAAEAAVLAHEAEPAQPERFLERIERLRLADRFAVLSRIERELAAEER